MICTEEKLACMEDKDLTHGNSDVDRLDANGNSNGFFVEDTMQQTCQPDHLSKIFSCPLSVEAQRPARILLDFDEALKVS